MKPISINKPLSNNMETLKIILFVSCIAILKLMGRSNPNIDLYFNHYLFVGIILLITIFQLIVFKPLVTAKPEDKYRIGLLYLMIYALIIIVSQLLSPYPYLAEAIPTLLILILYSLRMRLAPLVYAGYLAINLMINSFITEDKEFTYFIYTIIDITLMVIFFNIYVNFPGVKKKGSRSS